MDSVNKDTLINQEGEWVNFSGLIRARPEQVFFPENELSLIEQVQQSRKKIRLVGTGHSCTPLCATDELLISLDRFQGVEDIDSENCHATIRAGTKINALGQPLRNAGLATINQGDVDVQALAGAISTGTHGTGLTLGNLSSHVLGLRLVLASGELLECSIENDLETFKAAQIALGVLGLISTIDFQLLPAYCLHEKLWVEKDIKGGLDRFDELSQQNRHLEFFWYPEKDALHMKSLNPTDAEPNALPNQLHQRIGHSADIFPTVREKRFNEMEYAVPQEQGKECFFEIRELMQRRYPDVLWPIEYRTLAADDIFLSVACDRPSVTISIHQGAELPFENFFADAEAIFSNYQGRPHWGKCHTLKAQQLSALYPHWESFLAVRRRLDPSGRFMNDYLHELFGE